jgi:heat shock protein HslJ
MAQAQDFLGKWKLTSLVSENEVVYSTKKNVTLNINKDGKLGGNGGCNAYGGSYEFEKPNKIKISDIISTKMYCEETSPLENSYFGILQQAHTIKAQGNMLEIIASTGSVLRFARENNQLIKKINLYIQPKKIDCQGIVLQKCYLMKYSTKDGWKRFYDEIEGFDFEEGYYYLLEVERTRAENPPKDTSGFTYKLVKIVKKSRKKL